MSWETATHCPQPPWLLTQRGHLGEPPQHHQDRAVPQHGAVRGWEWHRPCCFGASSARSRPGEALTPPCPPPNEALLRAVLCQGREGFLLSHLPTSTSGQSWSMAEQRARVKWERQGAEGACQQQAVQSSPVPHSLKNGQAPKQPRGASERPMQGRETARGQTGLNSYNRHKAIRVMGEEAHPDCRDAHCLHQCG